MSKKHINGKINPRGTDSWHMIINSGYDESGKRNRISISTGLPIKGNMRKAEVMLSETIRQLEECRELTDKTNLKELYTLLVERGLDNLKKNPVTAANKSSNPLFSDVINQWLEVKQARTSENNCVKYGYAIKHINSFFEGIHIRDLTTLDIDKYYTIKLKGNKPLSAKTLQDHKAVINSSIEYAIKVLKVISDNPAEAANSPRKLKKIPRYFDSETFNEVLEKIQGNAIESAVIMSGNYGLRRQEVLALCWSDIDFEKMEFVIRHTYTQVGKKRVNAERTKSMNGFRTFPLTEQIAQYLKDLKAQQEENHKLCGNAYVNNDYVCKWSDGRRILPNTLTRKWSKFLEANGFKHISYHDLRHTCASMLLKLGLSLEEIRDYLGVSDISTVLIYAHLDSTTREKAISKLNEVIVIPKKNLSA